MTAVINADVTRWSPHFYAGRLDGEGNRTPIRRIIVHSTRGGVDDGGDFTRTLYWFANTNSKASAHIVIGHEGEVGRCVSDLQGAWHAGDGLGPMNLGSLAIEFAQELPTTEYTDAQIASGANVCGIWCAAYGLDPRYTPAPEEGSWWNTSGITGHAEYDATKTGRRFGKTDPGTLFPWPEFIRQVRESADRLRLPATPVPAAERDPGASERNAEAAKRNAERIDAVETALGTLTDDVREIKRGLRIAAE